MKSTFTSVLFAKTAMGTFLIFLSLSLFAQDQKSDDPAYTIVEKMPRMPGCENLDEAAAKKCSTDRTVQFVAENLRYPKKAEQQNLAGNIFVYYEVSNEGKVENIRVIKGLHPLLDEEAVKVIQNLPTHIPGMQDGKTVRVGYTIPIKFSLTD